MDILYFPFERVVEINTFILETEPGTYIPYNFIKNK